MPGTAAFRVVIVGDGPEREALTKLAAQLGLQEQVILAGFQRDTGPYYAMATVVACRPTVRDPPMWYWRQWRRDCRWRRTASAVFPRFWRKA